MENEEIENSFVTDETKNYLENLSSSEKMWAMVLLCLMLTGGDKFGKNQGDKSEGKNGAED